MMNSYLEELFHYLSALSNVHGSGHYVNDEIKEVIQAIRVELGLDYEKKKKERDSKFLVFDALLNGATFNQKILFEASQDVEDKIELMFDEKCLSEVEEAINALVKMKVKASFEVVKLAPIVVEVKKQ